MTKRVDPSSERPFSSHELKVLAQYADLGIQLQRCNFFDSEVTKISLNSTEGSESAELAPNDVVSAALVPIRRMLTSGEPTFYQRCSNLMKRSAPHSMATEHCDECLRNIDSALSKWLPAPVKPYPSSPQDLIKNFLNTKYFHSGITLKSKDDKNALSKWHSEVGRERTEWLFQTSVQFVGVYLIDHASNAVAAFRRAVSLEHANEVLDLEVSEECAMLLGVKSGSVNTTKRSLYEDDLPYNERYRRTIQVAAFRNLEDLLSAVDCVELVANTSPEKPLMIEDLLRSKNIAWQISETNSLNETSRLGTFLYQKFKRLKGQWCLKFDGSIVFDRDAIPLMNLLLAQSRLLAARPRSLSRRLHYIEQILTICDLWLWEETIDNLGNAQYQAHATANFTEIFPGLFKPTTESSEQ